MTSGGVFYVIVAEFDLPAVTVENYESVVPLFYACQKGSPPFKKCLRNALFDMLWYFYILYSWPSIPLLPQTKKICKIQTL